MVERQTSRVKKKIIKKKEEKRKRIGDSREKVEMAAGMTRNYIGDMTCTRKIFHRMRQN